MKSRDYRVEYYRTDIVCGARFDVITDIYEVIYGIKHNHLVIKKNKEVVDQKTVHGDALQVLGIVIDGIIKRVHGDCFEYGQRFNH